MASGSTMVAIDVLDSRDSSLSLLPQEQNVIGKGTQRKTRQRGPTKNPALLLPTANKRTADQAFYDGSTELVVKKSSENPINE